jgi:hypothetical protein
MAGGTLYMKKGERGRLARFVGLPYGRSPKSDQEELDP